MPNIKFGALDAANRIRNNPKYKPFLKDSDNAATKTVELKDATPDPAVSDIQGEAAETKQHKAEEHGKIELTKQEKKKLGFGTSSGTDLNYRAATSIKGIARGKGIDDWTQFVDEQASVDDHRSILDSAKHDDRGRRGLGKGRESDEVVNQRIAEAHQQRKAEELPTAKKHAFGGDQSAQEFVSGQGSTSEVFDISLSRTDTGGIQGSGRDFERLEEAHESRSSRARTLDEKKSAQPTRDPFQWMNNKSKFDYPGVDTVEPSELHAGRSTQAQARDERNAAPLTENKQRWAMNPGRYDFEGVDDVDPEELHASRSERARSQDEDELAPIADTKQQWAQAPDRWDWRGVDTPSEDLSFVEDSDNGSESSGMEFFREVGGERTPASAILDERPRSETVDAPGLAPEDFEEFGMEAEQDVERRTRQANAATKDSFAGGVEADMAFTEAEMERAEDEIGSLMDNRPENDDLTSFGMETDATQHRESREAVEEASEFGIDDRSMDAFESSESDGGEQRGFEEFGGGVRENETLF